MNRHPAYLDWERRAITVSSGPEVMMVNSTARCNLSCFMCSHSVLDEMPVTFSAESLDPFFMHINNIYFAGGEPFFLKPGENRVAAEIFDRLLVHHPHIRLNAFSNGTLFNGRMARIALDRFGSIHFSIDSLDPAIYAKVRGKPMLENVLANVERLVRLKRERGGTENGEPHICFNSIVMNETVEGLPAVAEKLAEAGGRLHVLLGLINHISPEVMRRLSDMHGARQAAGIVQQFQHRVHQSTFDPLKYDSARLDDIRGRLMETYRRHGIKCEDQLGFIETPGQKPPPPEAEAVCSLPWTMAHTLENGDVFCCCANNIRLGNLREHSFGQIWNGPAARDLRASFISGEMKGCCRNSCPAIYDHFKIREGAYSAALLERLEDGFKQPGRITGIVLLRTAPDYQSHLAARTLTKYFPRAAITVITNEAGAEAVRRWGMPVEVAVYPGAHFEPETFARWWPDRHRRGLAVALYNNNERSGYEGVERILASLNADHRIGILPDGHFLNF